MDASIPLCTAGFVLRTFEAVLSLSAMIVVLTATGEQSCEKTMLGLDRTGALRRCHIQCLARSYFM